MKGHNVASLAGVAVLAAMIAAGCAQSPAPAPTQPAKSQPAATTLAAPASQPTAAPAKAAEPTKAAEPAKVKLTKPIQFIVPFNAGAGSDVSTRVLTPGLEKELGVPIEVANKTGAGSQTGITEFVRSKADGTTLAMTNIPTTISLYLDKDRQAIFARKDFQTVAAPVLDPGIIVVGKDSPYKSLKELVDAAKAKPETVKGTTTGILSAPHIELLRLGTATGAKFAVVHFDGAAPATTALLGGHVDWQPAFIGDVLPQVKSGQVRALAVVDSQRSPYLPDVPTAKEQGVDLIFSNVRGYALPAGTPKEVVATFEDAFKKVTSDPAVKAKQDEMGLTQKFLGAAEFGQMWDQMEKDVAPLIEAAKAAAK
jgi:tripartite-type tricarboxylate transporter receptor subunit TctC